eukprot:5981555-Alexandrium_andersonii.AAC.1
MPVGSDGLARSPGGVAGKVVVVVGWWCVWWWSGVAGEVNVLCARVCGEWWSGSAWSREGSEYRTIAWGVGGWRVA